MLDRRIRQQDRDLAAGDVEERPAPVAQAGYDHRAGPGSEAAQRFALRRAVESALDGSARVEHDHFRFAGGEPQSGDAAIVERRGEAVAAAVREPLALAIGGDLVEIVEKV